MNSSWKIAFLICGGLLSISVGVIFLVKYLITRPRYVYREIAQDIKVNENWIELTPSSTMKMNRRFQAVTLVIEGAKTSSIDLFLKDGTQIRPEIQIEDVYGDWYELRGGSYTVRSWDLEKDTHEVASASFKPFNHEFPTNTQFRRIKIRSDQPFVAKKVIWKNYNPK